MGNPSEPNRDYGAEAESVLRSAEVQVELVFSPLCDIGVAIVRASMNSRDIAMALIESDDVTARREKEVYLFFEFVYFFMHMTLRKAFGRISESRLRLLQDFLLAIVPATAIDSYFVHWPSKLKNDINDEFIERLDETEFEYGTCTADGEVSRILVLLSRNLLGILGRGETEVLVLRTTLETVTGELKRMRLTEYLDQFSDREISERDEMRLGEWLNQFRLSSS